MTAHEPLLTIVVPLHNGATHIEATLTSLQNQRDDDFEVVVIDDGSTDDGPEIALRHPLASRLVRQSQLGVAVARNRGALEARGRWLTFLDQDDLWHESRIERIRPVLESTERSFVLTAEKKFADKAEKAALERLDPGLAGVVDAWIDPRTEVLDLCGPTSSLDVSGSESQHDIHHTQLLSATISMSTSFFIRPTHLRLAGGWSPHARSIDDWWLMVNAARLEPILVVDQPTLLYRVHVGATSRTTRYLFPYATSLLALRFGQNLAGQSDALTHNVHNDLLDHMVEEIVTSKDYDDPQVRSFVRNILALLRPEDNRLRTGLRNEFLRHAPWVLEIRHRHASRERQ